MQAYLVTGGTGFVGRALCAHLASQGCALTVLSRDPERAARVLPPGTRIVGTLDELATVQDIEAVINLAGEPIAEGRWSARRKRILEASRIGLTENLVQWMSSRRVPPRVFVSASAIGFYGDQGDRIVTEDSAPRDDYAHRLCAAWEAAAQRATDAGIRTAIVRIGLVVAPGGGFLARMLPPFRLGLGGPIGSGAQWMSWVHRDDLIALIGFLVSREDLSGVFNATAPQPVTGREFARTLGRVLRRPAVLPAPAFVFRLVFGEMASLLLTGQRVLPERATAAGFGFGYRDLEGALRATLAR